MRYAVLNGEISDGNKIYRKGDFISLTEQQAGRLMGYLDIDNPINEIEKKQQPGIKQKGGK